MTRDILKEIPLFATLNDQELDELQGQLQRQTVAPHTVIFWMDEPGERLYIVEKGQVRISHTNEEGQDQVLATLGGGAFFGELSLIDGGPHTATARAVGETTVLTLDRATFYNFLDKHPQFSQTVLAVLADRLRASTHKMRRISNINEEEALQRQYWFQHIVDKAARVVASGGFLIFTFVFLFGWIIVQTWLYREHHHAPISFADRPPTFYLLGFLLTFTSFLLTILVLTSQRRQAERDRLRGEIEYQVNLKAQAEIMRLQLKMDEVIGMLQAQNESGKGSENRAAE